MRRSTSPTNRTSSVTSTDTAPLPDVVIDAPRGAPRLLSLVFVLPGGAIVLAALWHFLNLPFAPRTTAQGAFGHLGAALGLVLGAGLAAIGLALVTIRRPLVRFCAQHVELARPFGVVERIAYTDMIAGPPAHAPFPEVHPIRLRSGAKLRLNTLTGRGWGRRVYPAIFAELDRRAPWLAGAGRS